MIQVNGLTKKFGDFTALSALDCTIPAGCIYGLVGSNGAGKSTLLRLICGIYRPNKGNVTLDGRNIYENPELKEKLVFVPDELYFLPQANMLRMAQTYASFYPRFDRSRFGELTDAFKLNPKANLGTFSKGMRRQAAMVLALSCRADFLFLDEPTSGVDPRTRREFWKHINALTGIGVAVLVTTHFMEEAEYCDDIALIYRGAMIASGTPDSLKRSVRTPDTPDPTLEDAFIACIENYNSEHPQ